MIDKLMRRLGYAPVASREISPLAADLLHHLQQKVASLEEDLEYARRQKPTIVYESPKVLGPAAMEAVRDGISRCLKNLEPSLKREFVNLVQSYVEQRAMKSDISVWATDGMYGRRYAVRVRLEGLEMHIEGIAVGEED